MTNCPPVYRNLQCENFGNKRKITSQLLRQFCKNDAYLKEQIDLLWDATDPESRKRFYPPDFMDINHSFGIESYILNLDYELEEFNHWSSVYRFNRTTRWNYIFDFDGSNDKIVEYDSENHHLMDGDVQYVNIYAESYLDVENSYNEQMLEIVNEDGVTTLRPPLCTSTYEHIIHYNAEYSTKKANTSSKYVTKQKEKLGKAKKDAHFYGAFNNWNCNNHWYNGFNRTKNYNIKSKWRKDPDSYEIPSVCHSQTFKAQNTGRVSKVNLNIQGSKSAVSPCIVEIRTTSKKGYPTTKVLARTERKFTGKGENIVAFEFKNKALVEKGKTYAIVVRSPLSKFDNTYRLGGWTTGCFSSEKKYYSGGSAFTSEDNGKTWKKNGKTKDTKSYGSHYYDWGINQKPIDFAFEVFVQPITQKGVKEKVTSSNIKTLIEQGYTLQENGEYMKLLKEAYDETFIYEYSYIQEGSYYLHLKPIQLNPIDNFRIFSTFSDEQFSSEWWTWEYYDIGLGEWTEVGNRTVEFDNNITNYTILKLRVRCDIEENTFIGITSDVDESLDNLITTEKKLATYSLTYLKSVTIEVTTKKSTQAYLRTLYYHPQQEGILGASIWSEIGVNAQTKGDATVEIDVIHEKIASEHFKFYDLNIINNLTNMSDLTLQQEELILIMREYINHFEKGDDIASYHNYSANEIIEYVYSDYRSNGLFLDYLKYQLTPVYLLPLYYNNATKPIKLFDKIILPHLPAYPINACETGDDDIIIDTSKFTGLSNYGFYYKLDNSIKNTLSSIDVTYTTKLDIETENAVVDENGFEINEIDSEERIEETLKGIFLDKPFEECLTGLNVADNLFATEKDGVTTQNNDIDYALTSDGMHIIFNRRSPIIQALFPNLPTNFNFATTLSDDTSVDNFELKINLTNKSYQEFVDFEVDYDNGTISFYNQTKLVDGDFNINYNPLWVRGLSIADFPLKMDLWKEQFRVATSENGTVGIYKLKYDMDNGVYVNDTFYEQTNINPYTNTIDKMGRTFYSFKTTVPPRDNIRKLVVNEGTVNERVLEEDSQFFVDYLANRITFYINDLSENDLITIHYTPNLTDDGLALGYRIKRNRYIDDVQASDDNFTAQPRDADDVYIGMNYFTYRT